MRRRRGAETGESLGRETPGASGREERKTGAGRGNTDQC